MLSCFSSFCPRLCCILAHHSPLLCFSKDVCFPHFPYRLQVPHVGPMLDPRGYDGFWAHLCSRCDNSEATRVTEMRLVSLFSCGSFACAQLRSGDRTRGRRTWAPMESPRNRPCFIPDVVVAGPPLVSSGSLPSDKEPPSWDLYALIVVPSTRLKRGGFRLLDQLVRVYSL
jgi:hypothetical protein